MTDDTASTTAATTSTFGKPIELDQPLQRGEQTINAVALRRPRAGELRGIDLAGLIRQLDYGALETLLPRISEPTLTRSDVANLDPADLTALAGEVVLFFVPKAAMAGLSLGS